MGLQRIDYNHRKEWTISEDNAVGPTTSSTLRSLTTATPTNANAYFVAPNGRDVVGSDSDPFLTIDHAVTQAIASATRNTVHIIRNGYVGDLDFAGFSTFKDLNSKTIVLQVALGETATIGEMNIGLALAGTGTLKLNGLYINKLQGGATAFTAFEAKWCDIYVLDIRNLSNTLKNSIFRAHADFDSSRQFGQRFTDVDDCAFDQLTLDIFISGASAIDHSTFYGTNSATLFRNDFIGSGSIALSDCILYQVPDFIDDDTNLSAITISYSLTPSNFTYVTYSNCIYDINPLFFDATNADFRLMDIRREAPDTDEYFNFTSKAVYYPEIDQDPSSDTRDLGPFDVSYTNIVNDWSSFEFDNEYWNDEIIIDFELANYKSFFDVRGNFHRTFDDRKRKITLSTVGNNYIGTVDSYQFAELLETDGAKRWYPNGDTGLFASSGSIVIGTDGSYNIGLSSISNLKQNAYKGFVAFCSSGAFSSGATAELRIASNNESALVLEDHRGDQVSNIPTSGNINVVCQYLPVEIDMQGMAMSFLNWNPEENPLYPENTEPESWEGHIRQLILMEVEDDE